MNAASCLAPETIAGLIDRTLRPDEHQQATAHVATCAICHELFLEAARTAADMRVASVRRFQRPVIALAAAAALVAALSLALRESTPVRTRRADVPQPPVTSPRLVDPVDRLGASADTRALAAAAWRSEGIGLGFGAVRPPSAEAILAGVRVADLEVAVLAGESERARTAASALGETLGHDRYRSLRERIRDRAPDAALVREVRAFLTADEEREALAFGRWLEAARLAAVARNAAFWTDGTRAILSRPPGGMPERAVKRLGEALAAAPPRSEADWIHLEEGLSEVLLLL
jgi:hypothetical protein